MAGSRKRKEVGTELLSFEIVVEFLLDILSKLIFKELNHDFHHCY